MRWASMKRVVVVWIALTVLSVSVAQAKNTYVSAFVPGDSSPTIKVAALDDPASPYFGQYSALDQWVLDNVCYYINDENCTSMQLAVPNIERALKNRGLSFNIETYRSMVELNAAGDTGYLVPILAFLEREHQPAAPRTLGDATSPGKREAPADPQPYFWSLGIEDEAALAEYHAAISTWLAPDFPPLAEWVVAAGRDGDQYSFLPDGGVVICALEVKDDLSQRQSLITRYDAGGNVLKQAPGDYMDWERLMLNDIKLGKDNPYFMNKELFAESGRKLGSTNNILQTGRYMTYRNAERDGYVAVIDYWLGKVFTPADGDLNQLPLDPYPYFGMVDHEEIARIYAAQQALAAAGQT